MTGALIGLDYASIESVLRIRYPSDRHAQLFDDVQVMEHAVLNEVRR